MRRWLILAAAVMASPGKADERLQLAADPHLAPDGQTLLFVHQGDVWRVPTVGGRAQRLTSHPARDEQPRFSPDGGSIAFVSDRTGSTQVFVVDADQGEPRQVTWHSEGYALEGWYPDGRQLLVRGVRDHFWGASRSTERFFRIDAQERTAEQLLFNDYGRQGQVSPDGQSLLFVREGEQAWRKGYHGSRAGQIWLYRMPDGAFEKLLQLPEDCFSPLWKPDGTGFYYCTSHGAQNGARNLWQYDLATKESRQITRLADDLVEDPTISADGKTIVFAHLFDLYRLRTDQPAEPQRIDVQLVREDAPDDVSRRTLKAATDVAFSGDGLELAFIAGGDVWVMETGLREPVRVTATAEFETDPVFIDDDRALVCVSWEAGEPDLWKIERADPARYWWQNREFRRSRLTHDAAVESKVKRSPDGKHLAYVRERGDVWLYELSSGQQTQLVSGFSLSGFDFSPDGRWIAYARSDDNFNADVWVQPLDGSSAAVNVSRHPDNESHPLWSPDGKLLAFTGRRTSLNEADGLRGDEIDIHYVWLAEADHDSGTRDHKLAQAIAAFEKARLKPDDVKSTAKAAPESSGGAAQADEAAKDGPPQAAAAADRKSESDPKLPVVRIDLENIHRRVREVSIPGATESLLGWSPDGKKLLFTARLNGEQGTYSIEFPDQFTPKKITSDTGELKGWLKSPDRMLWLKKGVPALQPLTGGGTDYAFSADQELSRSGRHRAAFEAAWRTMRDHWYDDNFGNHNWDAVRRKYVAAAESAVDGEGLSRVVHLMLGELNGSHLGFTPTKDPGRETDAGDDWRPVTGHLGVRFDSRFRGPGWKIRDVIADGPADRQASALHPGEVVLRVDDTAVDPALDPTLVLNGRLDRDIRLRVRGTGAQPEERDVLIRPATYTQIRSLLYDQWQDENRRRLAARAPELGYLHIQGMNWSSFQDFERELYDVGYGKEGLIIDVRDNGGGFTTDHLLTALTQPRHAVTVPRGGGPGYPQDRMVYATWDKPIVVLCNQNSFSNAEIFCHAIKGLGRGRLVGVATAGGVVSTGRTAVIDAGELRLPHRGWFVRQTGEDMELNGAVPDVVVWPRPGEIPSGKDRQLNRAIRELQQSVQAWRAAESPPLRKATERE